MKVVENRKIAKAIGFGSVSDVPRLPQGFADVFQSYFVDSGGVKLHAVIGGSGNPLLLLAGWPQNSVFMAISYAAAGSDVHRDRCRSSWCWPLGKTYQRI